MPHGCLATNMCNCYTHASVEVPSLKDLYNKSSGTVGNTGMTRKPLPAKALRTQQSHTAAAPAPKLPQAHRSSIQKRHQRPSSHTHTAAAHGSGTSAQAPTRTQQRHQRRSSHAHTAGAPYSTQARKRTHASLPTLEIRTPIAHAIWGKTASLHWHKTTQQTRSRRMVD